MKKYKLINALLAVCLMFTACQELTEPTYTDIPTVGTRDAENITNRTAKFISIDRDVKYKVSLSETFDEFQEYTLDEYSNVQREYYKEVNGLTPNTTYYYYAYVSDGVSEVRGDIKSFTTLNLLTLKNVTLKDWDGTEKAFANEQPIGTSLFGSSSFANLKTNYNDGSWTFSEEISAGIIDYLYAYWPLGYYKADDYSIFNIQTYKYDGIDLLYSEYTKTNEDKSSASLVMHHAMARVIFHFSIAEDNQTDSEEVNYLDIDNGENILPTIADFSLEQSAFNNLQYKYPLQYAKKFTITKGKQHDITIYSIPTNGGGNVDLTLGMANGSQVSTNIGIEWERGKTYEYNITYKKGMLTVGDVRVEDWDNNDEGDIPVIDQN